MPKAELGDTVIYTSLHAEQGSEVGKQHPAIVTKVQSKGYLTLSIFYPYGIFMKDRVPFSEEYANGHWSFRPRS